MRCHRARRHLSAFLDGDLRPAVAAQVRTHITGCAECCRVYEAYRRDARTLQHFVHIAPWLPVASRVRARLDSRRPAPIIDRRSVRGAVILLALAIFAVLAVGIGSSVFGARRIAHHGQNSPPAAPLTSPDRTYIYRVTVDHAIRIFDLHAMRVVADAALPFSANVLSFLSPDDVHLYVAYEAAQPGGVSGHVDVFDVATGRRIADVAGLDLMGEGGSAPLLAPSRDGHTVYIHTRKVLSQPGQAGRDACAVATFDVATNQLLPDMIPLPDCRMSPFLLSGDGRTLYSGAARIDLTASPPTVRDNPDLVDAAVVRSPDGQSFYVLDESGTLAVWDANAGTVTRRYENIVPSYGSYVYLMNGLALSPDGTRLFIAITSNAGKGYFDGIVALDAATGRRIASVRLVRPALFTSFTADADGAAVYFTTYTDAGSSPANTLMVWEISKDETETLSFSGIATPTPVAAVAP